MIILPLPTTPPLGSWWLLMINNRLLSIQSYYTWYENCSFLLLLLYLVTATMIAIMITIKIQLVTWKWWRIPMSYWLEFSWCQCRGLMCIHRMKIVHRDIKSANCLVNKHWTVKICDFGLSRIMTESPMRDSSSAGTPEWMAPELIRNEPFTEKCDVFSLGVVMWELCTLSRPWEGIPPERVYAWHICLVIHFFVVLSFMFWLHWIVYWYFSV